VFLDSHVLFSAIDLTGVASGVATREGLALLREAGALTVAFDTTLGEMRRILSLYEDRLATAQGRLSLYPTPLARHSLTAKLTPSDIRTVSATLERRLSRVGMAVRTVPTHDARYTLDEPALGAALADPSDHDAEKPRVRHDVDCVAAVLTLRAGKHPPAIETSAALFCTTSGRVIRNVQRWHREQGEHGAPPIVHQAALTSIAWVKRPATARAVKMHELAALCVSALRPTRETWERFVSNVRKLRQDNVLTDDETVALVASEMTDPMLAAIDDDMEPDADTIQDAIERVRESYREDAQAATNAAIQAARSDASIAQEAAVSASARADTLEQAIESDVQSRANRIAKAAFAVGTFITVVAAVVSIPGVIESGGAAWVWSARIVAAASAAFGAHSQIHGPSLRDLRSQLQRWTADRLRQRSAIGRSRQPPALDV